MTTFEQIFISLCIIALVAVLVASNNSAGFISSLGQLLVTMVNKVQGK